MCFYYSHSYSFAFVIQLFAPTFFNIFFCIEMIIPRCQAELGTLLFQEHNNIQFEIGGQSYEFSKIRMWTLSNAS